MRFVSVYRALDEASEQGSTSTRQTNGGFRAAVLFCAGRGTIRPAFSKTALNLKLRISGKTKLIRIRHSDLDNSDRFLRKIRTNYIVQQPPY
jgi:hypothetical protein